MLTEVKLSGMASAAPSTTFRQRSLVDLITPGRLKIDRMLARRILDDANYDRQRGTPKASLDAACALVQSANWIEGYQIWFVRLDGELHLVDGQHRITGVWLTGVARTFTCEIIEGETIDDVHDFYKRFDRFGRKRTNAEMLTADGFAEAMGIGKQVANAAFNCASLLASDLARPARNEKPALVGDQEKLDFLKPWKEQLQAFNEILKGCSPSLSQGLRSVGVMAVALLTLRDQPASAREFWAGVANNDGLRKGDPRHTLVTTLQNRQFTGPGQSERSAAVAWNAHYEGRKISFIRLYENGELTVRGVRRVKRK